MINTTLHDILMSTKVFQVELLVIAIASLHTGILFYRSRNGLLRKLFIWFFMAFCLFTLVLLYSFTFQVYSENLISIALMPLMISSIRLVLFLFKKYG